MVSIYGQLPSGDVWTSVLEKHNVIGFVIYIPWGERVLEWDCGLPHWLADTEISPF